MKCFFIVLAFFICGSAFAQQDMQTIATVRLFKTEPITVKQLKNEVETIEKAVGRKLSVEERREVLDTMINQRLALQGAERDKVSVTDAEVNQQINELRSQHAEGLGRNPTDTEFAEKVRQQTGMDLPAFRDQYKKQLIVQKYLLDKKRATLEAAKPPNEAEIKSFYENKSSDFVQPETIEFSAILIPYNTDSQKASARNDAANISKAINGNASAFDEKVQQGRVSNATYKASTGNLMPRNAPGVPEDFVKNAFSLEQGKVSTVLEIPTGAVKGFYIIKVTGKYPKKLLGLEDVILNVPPDWQLQLQGRPLTVRMFITAGLSQQKQQEAFLKAQEELIADLRKGNPFTINEQYINY